MKRVPIEFKILVPLVLAALYFMAPMVEGQNFIYRTQVDTLRYGLNGFTGIKDTYISGGQDTLQNFGAMVTMRDGVQKTNRPQRILIWVNTSGITHYDGEITDSVRLKLYPAGVVPRGSRSCFFGLRDVVFGTGDGTAGQAEDSLGATWYAYNHQAAYESLWAVAGAESGYSYTDWTWTVGENLSYSTSACWLKHAYGIVEAESTWDRSYWPATRFAVGTSFDANDSVLIDVTAPWIAWDTGLVPNYCLICRYDSTALGGSYNSSEAVDESKRPTFLLYRRIPIEPRHLGGDGGLR